MIVYLLPNVKSLTGFLNSQNGYFLQSPKRIDGVPTSYGRKGPNPPPGGHWRFICECASLAKQRILISSIEVSGFELAEALQDAGLRERMCAPIALMRNYTADEINYMKETFNL